MKHSKEEIEQYVEIVDKVAIISKTDLKGNITFVNDIFCDVAGYTREELIGQPHNILRHPDMPKATFANLWETIQSKQVWNGKIKNRAKNGNAYHVNANILPVHDKNGNVLEYMAVRFLMTEEMEEQRKFKAQVIKKLGEEKSKQLSLNKEIKQLYIDIKQLQSQNSNSGYAAEQLEVEKKNKKKMTQQLHSYENELANMTKMAESTIKNAKTKTESIELQAKIARDKIGPLESKIVKLTSMMQAQKTEIVKLDDSVQSQAKVIVNLKDVILSLEEDKRRLINGESLLSM